MSPPLETIDPRTEVRRIDQRYTTLRTLIRCVAGIVLAYFMFHSVEAFAGKSTEVSMAFALVVNALVEFKFIAAITLAGVASAWAVVERWLRHRTVKSMQDRIRSLENEIDPNRSTSGLTPTGETNPRDVRR
jgi:hypothetical protein